LIGAFAGTCGFAVTQLSAFWPALLGAASESAAAGGAGNGEAAAQALPLGVRLVVDLGAVTLVAGVVMCLIRILRGPHLADRVLAADTLSMQVVGLVILLTIRIGTTAFFDVALVVAIIGFATTLAFAQYIGAGAKKGQNPTE